MRRGFAGEWHGYGPRAVAAPESAVSRRVARKALQAGVGDRV